MSPVVPVQRKTKFFGFTVGELLISVSCLICLALYRFFDVQLRSPLRLLIERVLSIFGFYCLVLVLAMLIVRLLHLRAGRKQRIVPPHSETWKIFKAQFLYKQRILGDIRYLLSFVILFVVFIQLKHIIPYVNARVLDKQFDLAERALFRGSLGSELAVDFFGPGMAPLLAQGYFLFYPFIATVIYVFTFYRDERLKEEFLFGFALVWLVGIVLVYILPTLGPCFIDHRYIDGLPRTGVTDMQIRLQHMRETVLRSGKGVYMISGFPSLHIAAVLFSAIMLWRISKKLVALSVLFLIVTFASTLYFGWHYAVDDIGGVILAVVVARFVRKYYQPFYVITR